MSTPRLLRLLGLALLASCGAGSEEVSAPVERAGEEGSDTLQPLAFDAPVSRPIRRAEPGAALEVAEPAPAGAAAPDSRESDSREPEATAPLPGEAVSVDPELTRAVEASIASAMKRASGKSGGKVDDRNTAVAVMAIEVSSGRILVQRLSELPLVPASNLKLMTAAAALVQLGAEGAFVTPFVTEGAVEGGVLQGDLVVRAGGDPMYRREGDGSLSPWLDPLAAALRDAGVTSIAGSLVLDEGSWLVPGPGPAWPAPSQYWRDYCALAGGFSANGGCFRATVTPGASGAAAGVVLRPRHHGLQRKGSVKTSGGRVAVNVGANRGGVTVRGKIKPGSSPYVAEFSHPDPVELFGHAVVGGLADRGLEVRGGFRRERDVALEAPRVLHEMRSPITSVMDAILLDSNNAVADQLFLATGAATGGAGTREAGAAAVRDALGRLGLNVRPLIQVDGSGLSKENRATAQQLTALVAAVVHQGGEMRAAVMDALPVAGRTGKLSSRMRGTAAEGRVRAKTGWVKGASSLSGVAVTEGGEEIAFSILVGYPLVDGMNTVAWKPMQDEICAALASWDGAGDR